MQRSLGGTGEVLGAVSFSALITLIACAFVYYFYSRIMRLIVRVEVASGALVSLLLLVAIVTLAILISFGLSDDSNLLVKLTVIALNLLASVSIARLLIRR